MKIDFEQVLANSYQDFHAKGFDYLCLFRSPELTLKAYFFEGDVAEAPEVVMPHDHRYGFTTHVLAGHSLNRLYEQCFHTDPGALPYDAFDYRTVLNGGDGFAWRDEIYLTNVDTGAYKGGERYTSRPDDIHTIRIMSPETVLLLEQGPDVVALGAPTSAYRFARGSRASRQPPSLSGLYSEMSPDRVLARLALLKKVAPQLMSGAELVI